MNLRDRLKKAAELTVSDPQRIVALPTMSTRPYFQHDLCISGERSLWPHQAACLQALQEEGGCIGLIGVGQGKTLIAALAATVLGISPEQALLLLPAGLESEFYRQAKDHHPHFRLTIPRILRYSILSRPSGVQLLEDMQPELIILDEAHRIANLDSARGRRLLYYLCKHPNTQLLVMSGTLIRKSIKDLQVFCKYALGHRSPLPLTYGDTESWAAVLDQTKGGRFPQKEDFPRLEPVAWWYAQRCKMDPPAGQGFAAKQSYMRKAFHERLTTAPGVVATTETSCDASIYFQRRRPALSPVMKKALKSLEDTWELPDGTELCEALEMDRARRQLSLGYYYKWDWPNGVDQEWMDKRKAWHKELRGWLKKKMPGVDSPKMVEDFVRYRQWGKTQVLDEWMQVKARWFPHPPVKTVWLDGEWFDETILRISLTDDPIVWYSSRAECERLRSLELLEVVKPGQDVRRGRRPVALSIKSHGTGLNLQEWTHNVVLSPPSAGDTWEQLVGRTHRPGQEADEVWFEVFVHTPYLNSAWSGAKEGARFLFETTGGAQKLLLGTEL